MAKKCSVSAVISIQAVKQKRKEQIQKEDSVIMDLDELI